MVSQVRSVVDKTEYTVLTVPHEFRYTFDEPILVTDLISSLKAYETLTSSFLPAILNELLDIKIHIIQVSVSEIERGSFLEKLLFNLLFKDEAAYNDFCSKARKFLGTEQPDGSINMTRIIMLAMGALLGVGVGYLLFNKPAEQKEAVINNVINIINTDKNLDLSGEDLVEIVKAVTGSKRQKTADNVAKVYAPAAKNQGSITLGADGDRIEPVVQPIIKTLPKEVDLSNTPLTESYSDIDVQIRATDRDKTTGWYAVIEQIVPSRVRLELPDDIDLNGLANNAIIRANVTIEYDLQKNGTRKPKKIILNELADS